MNWGKIPRGITVWQLRERDGYYQVQFDDWSNEKNKDYLTYSLTGWIKQKYASREKLRYYCLLDIKNDRDTWVVQNDHHVFKLFWSSMADLPQEIIPGNKWIKVLKTYIDKDHSAEETAESRP